jgi:hypothetical protein
MKRLILAIFILLFAVSAQAGTTLTFAWDASQSTVKYNVYQSATDSFTKASTKVCTDVTVLTCTVPNVPDGMFWYAATAKDAAGNESDFSTSISFNGDTIPPVKPGGFKITVTVIVNQ